jgi:DNA-binding MarR family transcriptional regulator
MRRLNGALAGVAMTHLQFIVLGLTAFFTQENPRPQARIAEYCAMDPMLLSKIMRTLEHKRLIVRRSDPLDTRIKLVSLAPAGDALLARSIPLFSQAYDEFFAPAGADEPGFHTVLMRLLRAMQSRENVPPRG